jgi:glycosyltransferase involved in cell wall biosynthesis
VSTRVVIFFPSVESGGLERAMVRITAALADCGFEIEVHCARCNTEIASLLDPRVKLVRARNRFAASGGRTRAALSLLPGFILGLIRRRPDCILTVQSSVLCIPVAALFGIPVIHRESSNSRTALSNQGASWKRRIIRVVVLKAKGWVYQACAFVVANSSGAAESARVLTGLPPGRVRVIHNPVDPEALRAQALQPVMGIGEYTGLQEFLKPHNPILAYVGRLSWEKDVATLVRGFARALQLRPDLSARLLVVGEGRDRAALVALAASLGVTDAIRFHGHTSNPYALLKHVQAFALTSQFEGLPNALLEAVALGVPSVSTDCPTGPREILLDGRGGWLVPVGDVEALAVAIAEMLGDPEEARRRAAVAGAALARFHPEAIGRQYAAIILQSMQTGVNP